MPTLDELISVKNPATGAPVAGNSLDELIAERGSLAGEIPEEYARLGVMEYRAPTGGPVIKARPTLDDMIAGAQARPILRPSRYAVAGMGGFSPDIRAEDVKPEATWQPNPNDLRPDGTQKGTGWLGVKPLVLPDGRRGVATEYTTQSDAVKVNGKRIDFPSLVPGLSAEQQSRMLMDIIPNEKPVPEDIMQIAIAHAKKRIAAGKSVFAPEKPLAAPPTSKLPNRYAVAGMGGFSPNIRAEDVLTPQPAREGKPIGVIESVTRAAKESKGFSVLGGLPIPILSSMASVPKWEYLDAKKRLLEWDYAKPNPTAGVAFGMGPGGGGWASPKFFDRKYDEKVVAEFEAKRTEEQKRGFTTAATILGGIKDIVPWVADIAFSGGARAGFNAVVKGAVKSKSLVKAIQLLGGAGIAALHQPGRFADTYANVKIQYPDLPEGQVAIKTATRLYTENLSEMTGEIITKGALAVGKPVLQRLPFTGRLMNRLRPQWMKITGGTAAMFAEKISTKTGIDGLFGEVGEEFLNDQLQAIFNADDFGAGKDAGILERMNAALRRDVKALPTMIPTLLAPVGAKYGLAAVLGKRQAIVPAQPPPTMPEFVAPEAPGLKTPLAATQIPPSPVQKPTEAKPQVFYHGTVAPELDKTGFSPTESKRMIMGGLGIESRTSPVFFVTQNKTTAEFFAKNRSDFYGKSPQVYQVHFAPQNTLNLTGAVKTQKVFDVFKKAGIDLYQHFGFKNNDLVNPRIPTNAKFTASDLWEFLDDPKFVEALKSQGYDSVLIQEYKSKSLGILTPEKAIIQKPTEAKRVEATKQVASDYVEGYVSQYGKGAPGISDGLIRKDGESGELVYRDANGNPQGVLAYAKENITDIAVSQKNQRKGIATALIDEAKKRGHIQFQGPFTKEGAALVNAYSARAPQQPTAALPAGAVEKQPWEMTRKEYVAPAYKLLGTKAIQTAAWRAEQHKKIVQQALSEGKPVPRAVLEEYKGESWADEALAKQAQTPTNRFVVAESMQYPGHWSVFDTEQQAYSGTTTKSKAEAEVQVQKANDRWRAAIAERERVNKLPPETKKPRIKRKAINADVMPYYEPKSSVEQAQGVEKAEKAVEKPQAPGQLRITDKKPQNYSVIRVGERGTYVETPVKGYSVSIENWPDSKLLLYHEAGQWRVADMDGGLSIARGKTQTEALKKTSDILTSRGRVQWDMAITKSREIRQSVISAAPEAKPDTGKLPGEYGAENAGITKAGFVSDPTIEVKPTGEGGFARVGRGEPGGPVSKPWLDEEKVKSPDKDVEDFFDRTYKLPRTEKISSFLARLKEGLRERFIFASRLPNTPEAALARDMIRTMPEEIRDAGLRAIDDVEKVVTGDGTVKALDNAGLDLLRRKVFMGDLLEEAKIDRSMAGNFSLEQLEAENKRLDDLIAKVPSVAKAYQSRTALWDGVSRDLQRRGLLSEEEVKNKAYVRHFVLAYSEYTRRPITVHRKKLAEPRRTYLKQRMGSRRDISTHLLAVELTALSDIYRDNAIEDLANAIGEKYDKRAEYKTKADAVKKASPESPATPESLAAEDDYAEWHYKRPNLVYMAHTIAESQMAALIENGAEDMAGVLSIPKDKIREALVIGGKRKGMLIPGWLADQLNDLPVNKRSNYVVRSFTRPAVQFLKRWLLRVNTLRYNWRNTIGDAERLNAAGQTSAILKIPQAVILLITKEGPLYEAARRHGVVESSLWNEMGDPALSRRFAQFRNFGKQKSFKSAVAATFKAPLTLLSRAGQVEQNLTQFREDILRMAVFLKTVDDIQEGKPLRHWAGRVADIEEIAKTDPMRAAAKHSRETLIDYGAFTPFENDVLRNGLIPFYSFMKKNLTFWPRSFMNAAKEGEGETVVGAAARAIAWNIPKWIVRILGLYALAHLWNHRDDEAEKQESTIPFWLRSQPHLNIGKYTLWGDTALNDFAEWFGMEDLAGIYWRAEAGFLSPKEAAIEAARKIAQAPVNKVYQGLQPFLKQTQLAITGTETYPSVFHPRIVAPPASQKSLEKAILGLIGTDAKKFYESATGKRAFEDTLSAYFAGWWIRPMDADTLIEQVKKQEPYVTLKAKSTTTDRGPGQAKAGREAEWQELQIQKRALGLKNPVQDALNEAGVSVIFSRTIGKSKMTDEQYQAYQDYTAQELDTRIGRMVRGEGWSKLTDARKAELLKEVVSVSKEVARNKVRRAAK